MLDLGSRLITAQTAIEAVIAETAEEAAQATAAVSARVEELQAMLEDEVAQIEDLVNLKFDQVRDTYDMFVYCTPDASVMQDELEM